MVSALIPWYQSWRLKQSSSGLCKIKTKLFGPQSVQVNQKVNIPPGCLKLQTRPLKGWVQCLLKSFTVLGQLEEDGLWKEGYPGNVENLEGRRKEHWEAAVKTRHGFLQVSLVLDYLYSKTNKSCYKYFLLLGQAPSRPASWVVVRWKLLPLLRICIQLTSRIPKNSRLGWGVML